MSRIRWDERGQKVVETGVSRGVLYPKGKTGVVWNGLTAVNESSDGGEIIDLYADDIKYCSFRSAESYQATIEAYTYPEEFAECDGSIALIDGVYVFQQTRLPFDFCFRTEILDGDGNKRANGYKLHMVYNATASPASKDYASINDSPDAATFSWEIRTNPFVLDGRKASSTITIDTTKADRIAIENLEKILYGTLTEEPRMPDPVEVISILTRLDMQRFLMKYIIKKGIWVWDTFNFQEDTVPIAIDREAELRVVFEPSQETTFSAPSIAFSLIDEEESGRRKYAIIIIDDSEESDVVADFESTTTAVRYDVTESGGLYYYSYYLFA